MNTEGMIDITGADLVGVVKAAYDLSRPQGMGFMHYDPAPLSDADAQSILAFSNPNLPVSMDYVKGRACKFHVQRDEEGKLWISDSWYDHSAEDLKQLLARIGK